MTTLISRSGMVSIRGSNRISKAAALLAIATATAVMIGWIFGIEPLKRISPGFVAMNPVTAICFLLSGAALFVLSDPSGKTRLIARILATTVLLVGAVKLSGYWFAVPIQIDTLLFPSQLHEAAYKISNVMAPNTAFNFVLLGLALWAIHGRRSLPVSNGLALVVASTSLLALVGYAYGVAQLSRLSSIFIPMALHTALLFLILAAGVLFACAESPLRRMFSTESSTRVIAIRLFPASTVLIFVLGWLRLYGERHGFLPGALGTALFVVIVIIAFTGLIWWTAATNGTIEAEKRTAELALLNSRAELDAASRHLQLIMNHASELICSFDESDRFLTANEASHGLLGVTPDKLKGTSFLDIVHPEEREVTLQTLRSARVGIANVTLTIRCKRSDNTHAGIAWSFQWSSHYHTLFGVGRGSTGLESFRPWDESGSRD